MLIPLDHLCDDVLPGQPQDAQDVGMRCTRVVIEELDPPVVFSANLSGSPNDNRLEYLPSFDRLHRSNETVTAVAVTHLALAPLLLGDEQIFDRTQLGERVISE
jgi:hypothetical protein